MKDEPALAVGQPGARGAKNVAQGDRQEHSIKPRVDVVKTGKTIPVIHLVRHKPGRLLVFPAFFPGVRVMHGLSIREPKLRIQTGDSSAECTILKGMVRRMTEVRPPY